MIMLITPVVWDLPAEKTADRNKSLDDYWPPNLSVTTDTSQMPKSNMKLFNDATYYHLHEATAA